VRGVSCGHRRTQGTFPPRAPNDRRIDNHQPLSICPTIPDTQPLSFLRQAPESATSAHLSQPRDPARMTLLTDAPQAPKQTSPEFGLARFRTCPAGEQQISPGQISRKDAKKSITFTQLVQPIPFASSLFCALAPWREVLSRHFTQSRKFSRKGAKEIRDTSIEFVRKISGFTNPSQAKEKAFVRAVEEVAGSAGTVARYYG
jgi:hypothetical protein